MICFVVKSQPNPPNSFAFCSYKIHSRNPLSFQQLRNPLGSADSKGTLSLLDSAVTDAPLLTSLESALTKNREGYTPTIPVCAFISERVLFRPHVGREP